MNLNDRIQSTYAVCMACENWDHSDPSTWRCKASGKRIREHAVAGDCPAGKFVPGEPIVIPTLADAMRTRGPALWAKLHRAAIAGLLTPAWLADFDREIPCGACKTKWRQIMVDHPLVEGEDQFAKSVLWHNLVNEHLDPPKPSLAVEEARAMWTQLAGDGSANNSI